MICQRSDKQKLTMQFARNFDNLGFDMAPFRKILIANRGEIACRIIKTLKKLNIKSVAIYSKADKGALYTELADEAYEIGPAPARDSYLHIEKIVELALKLKVDAVHPGFGFLAENPVFAEKLQEKGIIFIGPNPRNLKLLGDKIEAKKIAHKLNIPILSGDLEPVQDYSTALIQSEKLGFPVLIKAVAGGGGKGMRRVYSKGELKDEIERAVSEAKSSFGDERVFIEKFIENPRHIEIQILADQHGFAIYLGERECSLQRRYQKIIEEAPSPFVDSELRLKLGQDALKIIKETGYYSAGTVEFLVDPNKNYYFLEVNPRLQVEHPVTELITGIDIVEQMIRIAQGEKLSITQKDVHLFGWAIEARICAEDPLRHFMPSIGRIQSLNMPQAEHIRIDTGIVEGSEISPYYDSMIAKAIAHKHSRSEAIQNLIDYLDTCSIKGLDHNIAFLQSLLLNPQFQKGDFSTKLIETTYPDGFQYKEPNPEDLKRLYKIACFYAYLEEVRRNQGTKQLPETWHIYHAGNEHIINLSPTSSNSADICLENDNPNSLSIDVQFSMNHLKAKIENIDYLCHFQQTGSKICLFWRDTKTEMDVVPKHLAPLMQHMPLKREKNQTRYVVSPMPGLLLDLKVAVGDIVKNGEPLAIIEAMKMENVVRSHREGKIIRLHVKPGESLKAEQPIIEFESVA
jgi:propionyl-CoA carboxylase alpha chain